MRKASAIQAMSLSTRSKGLICSSSILSRSVSPQASGKWQAMSQHALAPQYGYGTTVQNGRYDAQRRLEGGDRQLAKALEKTAQYLAGFDAWLWQRLLNRHCWGRSAETNAGIPWH